MYEETTFALVNLDRATSMADSNGHAIAFQPGAGAASVAGLPISLEQYVKLTSSWLYAGEPGGPSLTGGAQASGLGGVVNGLLALLLGGGN